MAQIFYRSGTTLFDRLGNLAPGAKIYFHPALTLDQLVVYRTSALTAGSEWSQPVVCDGYGMIPAVYLDDSPGGSYRYRITTAAGIIINDLLAVPYPTIGGGGGGAPDPTTVASTGWTMWQPFADILDGWIRLNGGSIGDAGSSASERALADCNALFTRFWTKLSNAEAPVSSGRGISAAADWGAKKVISVPDMRGRSPFGLDTMGRPAAGRLPIADVPWSQTPAGGGGASSKVLAVGNLPPHHHAAGTLITNPNGAHSHAPLLGTSFVIDRSGLLSDQQVGSGSGPFVLGTTGDYDINATTDTQSAHSHSVTGDTADTGSSGGFNIVPPGMAGTWFCKL